MQYDIQSCFLTSVQSTSYGFVIASINFEKSVIVQIMSPGEILKLDCREFRAKVR